MNRNKSDIWPEGLSINRGIAMFLKVNDYFFLSFPTEQKKTLDTHLIETKVTELTHGRDHVLS